MHNQNHARFRSSITLSSLLAISFIASINVQANSSGFDKAWDYANISEHGDSKWKWDGRLQADAAWIDADQGEYSDLVWRRFRFGIKGSFNKHFGGQLEADINLNNALDDWYNRLTEASLYWQFDKNHKIKILKHGAPFTLDGATSSKRLLTPQRNNLTNNLWFTDEYFTGLSVSGKTANQWKYIAGIYSSDDNDEISEFDASYFTLLSATYDAGKWWKWDKSRFRLDFVYNDEDPLAGTRDFEQVVSISSQSDAGQWSLSTDLAFGSGFTNQSDIWGLVLMPYYNKSDYIQYVFRYTFIDSDDPNGLRLGRYESRVASGRGDQYNELYAGVNWLFYGHKLKVHLGAQWANMDDKAKDGGEYDDWSLVTSFRMYW